MGADSRGASEKHVGSSCFMVRFLGEPTRAVRGGAERQSVQWASFRDLMCDAFSNLSSGVALHPARSTRGTPAESLRLVLTASHALYVLCCLKETRHRSRLRRRHLAREEAANEHRKRNDRGGRDRRGPALAPARGVWPRVHAPPGGRLGARVRTQGPRRRDRCVLLPRVPPSRERRAQIADLAVGTRQTKPPLPLRFAPLSAAPSRDPRSFDPASASSATPPTDRVDPLRVSPSPRHRDRSRRSRAQPRT